MSAVLNSAAPPGKVQRTRPLLLHPAAKPLLFNGAIRALGARRWQRLHRAVYAVALLALLHFFWVRAAKNHFGEVAVYAAIVALLLGWRIVRAARAKARTQPRGGTPISRASVLR